MSLRSRNLWVAHESNQVGTTLEATEAAVVGELDTAGIACFELVGITAAVDTDVERRAGKFGKLSAVEGLGKVAGWELRVDAFEPGRIPASSWCDELADVGVVDAELLGRIAEWEVAFDVVLWITGTGLVGGE